MADLGSQVGKIATFAARKRSNPPQKSVEPGSAPLQTTSAEAPASETGAAVSHLQHLMGNQAVGRLLLAHAKQSGKAGQGGPLGKGQLRQPGASRAEKGAPGSDKTTEDQTKDQKVEKKPPTASAAPSTSAPRSVPFRSLPVDRQKGTAPVTSDQLIAEFSTSSATSIAESLPTLGSRVTAQMQADRQEVQKSTPKVSARLGDGTKPDVAKKPAKKAAPKATAAAVEGGASAKAADEEPQYDTSPPSQPRTPSKSEPDMDSVKTMAGPPPQFQPTGEANPDLATEEQAESAAVAAHEQQAASEDIANLAGGERVQPVSLEKQGEIVIEQTKAKVETEASDEMQDFLEMDVPTNVRKIADKDMAPILAPNLKRQQDKVNKAAAQRDQQRQAAVDDAQQQAAQLSAEANQKQDQAIQDSRQQITEEKQKGVAESQQMVDDFSAKADARHADTMTKVNEKIATSDQEARDKIAEGESKARAKVQEGKKDAAAEKTKMEKKKKKKRSWWQKIGDFFSGLFDAFVKAVTKVFDVIKKAVNGILTAIKKVAVGIINAARKLVVGMIKAFSKVLKGMVNVLLAAFPKLRDKINAAIDTAVDVATQVVNAIADTLEKTVTALIDKVSNIVNFIINAYEAIITGGLQMMGALLSGDFLGAIKIMFLSICKAAGLPGEELLQILEKAASQLINILKNPIGFLKNLLKAANKGFQQFMSRFWQHMKAGLMGWLFGQLAATGIEIPKKFDLKSILMLVLQILGLTYENVRARAVRILGEEKVAMIEEVALQIKRLFTEGPMAVWEDIKQKVGDIKQKIIDGAKEWLITQIVTRAIAKIASLFTPVSAIVQAVITMYQTLQFFIQRIKQIMALVNAILDSIKNIAKGAIGAAANWIEKTMVRAIPVMLAFLASLLGIGDIGAKVRGIIEKLQAPVNKAIDWVILKIVGLAKAAWGKIKKGAAKLKGKVLGRSKKEPAAEAVAKMTPDQKKAKAVSRFKEIMRGHKGGMTRKEIEGVLVQMKGQYALTQAQFVEKGSQGFTIALAASPATFLPAIPVGMGERSGLKAGKVAAAPPAGVGTLAATGDYLRATAYDGPHPRPADEVENAFFGTDGQYQYWDAVPAAVAAAVPALPAAAPPAKKHAAVSGYQLKTFNLKQITANNTGLKTANDTNRNYLRAGRVEARSSVPRGKGRSGSGETVFGHFGVDEEKILTGNSTTNYNGGHLVGDQLMDSRHSFALYEDWNLAPQVRGFNSPVYTGVIENPVTKAIRAGATVEYNVQVQYPNNGQYTLSLSEVAENVWGAADPYVLDLKDVIGRAGQPELIGGKVLQNKNVTFKRRTPGYWKATAKVVAGGKTIGSGRVRRRQNIIYEPAPANLASGQAYAPAGLYEEVKYTLEIDGVAHAGPDPKTKKYKYKGATKVSITARQQTF